MAKFVRRLQTSSGKYKGKMPLKCFNYGKIGHFTTKCPYGDKNEDEHSSGNRSYGKDKKKNVYWYGRRCSQKQRSLYTHENDTTDEESVSDDSCIEDEVNATLFMAQEIPVLEEGEVDLEAELINALEELKKTRRDIKKVKKATDKEQEILEESLEESKKTIADLKLQLEEAKRICEVTSTGLRKKEKLHQNMEGQIVML